jgi:hypothetical protein
VHKREQDEDEHVESGGQDKIFPVSSASMVCDTTVNAEECDVSNECYIDRQCLDEHKCYHVSDSLCNTCGREIFESKSMQPDCAVKSDVTSKHVPEQSVIFYLLKNMDKYTSCEKNVHKCKIS